MISSIVFLDVKIHRVKPDKRSFYCTIFACLVNLDFIFLAQFTTLFFAAIVNKTSFLRRVIAHVFFYCCRKALGGVGT